MTLVDDYEPIFKHRGILAMTDVLERVSPNLLKRTGLDVLLLSVRIEFIQRNFYPP
jgi:hypothetical protein